MSQPDTQTPRALIEVAAEAEDTLYAVRQRFPRAVTGLFATWRWILVWATQLIFYGCAGCRGVIGRPFCWMWSSASSTSSAGFLAQDVFFLAILLIISAYSLFFFTAVAGRLWCGYACPQTVYTEIFMWIEEKIEGNRSQRMKLDAAPMSGRKLASRRPSSAPGVRFPVDRLHLVGYFTPIRELVRSPHLQFRSVGALLDLLLRRFHLPVRRRDARAGLQVHVPLRPLPGVMFDPDTLVITYDPERGEPRGPRKKADPKTISKGDCVDCGICVQVCPTGIDIRNGMQYECIGCAACIDACDQVMEKMNYPKGLIRYTTENAMKRHWGMKEIIGHVMRPRIMIYAAVLVAICSAFVWGLATRSTCVSM
jgi:cytochrome c oxidase accessory protein FixG